MVILHFVFVKHDARRAALKRFNKGKLFVFSLTKYQNKLKVCAFLFLHEDFIGAEKIF